MKRIALAGTVALAASFVSAESLLKSVNDKGYGTLSGRVQSLSMYRDFESSGKSGANTTLGLVLGYTSPEFAGFNGGLAYNYAGELHSENDSIILHNDEINVLNEGWIRYRFANSSALLGRKINNGEVFRADDCRQKSRSIEAIEFETSDISHTKLMLGHAAKLSNWIDSDDRWEFNNFGEVFGASYDTDGVTWGEGSYTGFQGLEIALFDAYAWDIANLTGTRTTWTVTKESALVGYYRHETDVGEAPSRTSEAFGLSLQQKGGGITLEPGFFSVHGDTLRFQETTTGINHPLGASMEICSGQFNGGADTAYLKVTAMLGKTGLYALYDYTWQDELPFDGQELNIVIKQPIADNLSVALKCGIGYRNRNDGLPDTTDTDTRLFLTYTF